MTQFSSPYRSGRLQDRHLRLMVLMTALLLHAAGLWALTQLEAGRKLLAEIKPILVSVIEQKPPPPKPPPPQPKPRREPPPPQPAAAPPPILAAEPVATAPAPAYEVPVPKTAPVAPAPVASRLPPLPPPEPIVPPSFNAAYLNNPPPAYPPVARRFGEQGRIVLRVLVSAQGDAETTEIYQSSGYARLDQAAIDAVQRWKFVPAKRGDTAVSAVVLVPIVFKLGD